MPVRYGNPRILKAAACGTRRSKAPVELELTRELGNLVAKKHPQNAEDASQLTETPIKNYAARSLELDINQTGIVDKFSRAILY